MAQTPAAVQAFLGTNPLNAKIVRAVESVPGIPGKQEWYVIGGVDAPGKEGWIQTNASDSAAVQAGVILAKLRNGPRVVPGGMNLPMRLMDVNGAGSVVTNYTSAVDAAIASLSSIYNPTACTVGTGGTDTVAGSNTFFATLNYACATWTGGSVVNCVSDGVYGGIDLRNTSTSQGSGRLLKVVKGNGYNVILRTPAAVDITTATFTADGTLTNIYGTPTSWLGGSAQVTRVLRTDQLDAEGEPLQFVKYASKAALAAATATNGFFWDNTANKQLWVHLAGDANVESNKAILKALYLDTSGNSRVVSLGGAIALDGVRMEGMQFVESDPLSGGTQRQSIWINNVDQLWATAKGFDGTLCGDFVATNSYFYATQQDGLNGFAPSAVTGQGLVLAANCEFVNCGDTNVFAADGTLQGISCHSGTNHVSWGNTFRGCNGPGVADTSSAGHTNYSWLVANVFEPQADADNLSFSGTGGTRKIYLDSNTSTADSGFYDLEILGTAGINTVYEYGSSLVRDPSNTSTPIPYRPDSL